MQTLLIAMHYRLIRPKFRRSSYVYFRGAIIVCALNLLVMMQCLLALERLQYKHAVPLISSKLLNILVLGTCMAEYKAS